MPSMIDGSWVKREFNKFDWADIENASPVSMIQIKWALPERYIDAHGNMQVVPFYALPYRLEGKGIRFFSRGWGWYFRDEVIFLKRWLETFARLGAYIHEDGSPCRLSKTDASRLETVLSRSTGPAAKSWREPGRPIYLVDLVEARLFYPANDERPFAFVPDVFERRKWTLDVIKQTGQYN